MDYKIRELKQKELQVYVKDFGKIMPGHGGLLDRLDSLIFVLPFYYFVFCDFLKPLITLCIILFLSFSITISSTLF